MDLSFLRKRYVRDSTGPRNSCSDCKDLLNGASSPQKPHVYLLPIAPAETSDTALGYRCLVCNSQLTLDRDGSRWQ